MMRECWAEVFVIKLMRGRKFAIVGTPQRHQASVIPGASYRLHIRLKPPGAPKRYADDNERRLWATGMLGPARASYISEKTRERLA